MDVNQLTAIKIKQLREEMGLKAENIAHELGISKAAMSQLENGHTEISITRLNKISAILGVPLETFLPNTSQNIQINKDKSSQNVNYVNQQHNYSDKQAMQLLTDAIQMLKDLQEKI